MSVINISQVQKKEVIKFFQAHWELPKWSYLVGSMIVVS